MANTFNWILISVFTAIVLYYMIYVAGDVSNTTSTCEAIEFADNETLTASAHTMLLYPTPVLYNSTDCSVEAGNYTSASGGFTLGFNETTPGPYYATYDYDSPTTVFGLGLSFMAILVTIGVGVFLAYKTIFKA